MQKLHEFDPRTNNSLAMTWEVSWPHSNLEHWNDIRWVSKVRSIGPTGFGYLFAL